MPSEANALSGNSSTGGTVTVPFRSESQDGDSYVVLYSPTSSGFPTAIYLDGNSNSVKGAFTAQVDSPIIDIAGDPHYAISNLALQNVDIIGTGTRAYSLRY